MLMFIDGKKFEGKTSLKEKWYGTDYDVDMIDENCLNTWQHVKYNEEKFSGSLYLPDKNDLIATNFDIREETAPLDAPLLLTDTTSHRVW